MKDLDNKLEEIARGCFNVATLKSRNSDRLDFYEVAVWEIKQALELAYALGRDTK